MKLKILRKFMSGLIEIREIEIERFEWQNNHEFRYVPIHNGHSACQFYGLEKNEDIVGLTI